MKAVQRIAKNTIVMVAGEVAGKVLSLIFIILVARYLKAEGFGILSFSLAFTGIFANFADIGFYQVTIRDVARDRKSSSEYITNVFLLKSVATSVTLLAMFFVVGFLGYPENVSSLIYVLAGSMILDALVLPFSSIFQAFEKMEYISLVKIAKNLAFVAGGIYLIETNSPLIHFGYLYLLTSLLQFALSATICLKIINAGVSRRINADLMKKILREGFPFWISSLFIVIINQTDKVMLSFLVNNAAVGIYSAAYRLIFTLNFVPVMFTMALYPVTSRLYVRSKETLRHVVERSFKYLLIFGITLAALVTIFGEYIISAIYGSEYESSVNVLKILAWSQLFLFLNLAYENLLKSINKQIIGAYQTSLAATLNVILNFLLIPEFSYIGASYSTLAARVASFAFLSLVIFKTRYRFSKEFIRSVTKFVSASSLTLLLSIHVSSNAYISAALFVLLLPPVLFWSGAIDSEDTRIIKGVFSEFILQRWIR